MTATDYTALMLAQLAPQFASSLRPRDPYGARRAYGMGVMQHGASSAPVASPLEGLARALQAGVGGYLVHRADRDQGAEEKTDAAALAAALRSVDKDGKPDIGAITATLARNPKFQGLAAMMQVANVLSQRQQGQAADTTRLITGAAPTGVPTAGGPPGVTPGATDAPPAAGGFNVGNIRMPAGQQGFRTFPTQDAAVAAVRDNLRSYPGAFNGGQPMSLLQIGARWAPKGDGANDPVAWANNVARVAGIDPRQPVDLSDPQVVARIAKGIHVAEFGQGAVYPDEVYLRGVGGGRPQAAAPAAQPPAPQMAAAPVEGGGIDDSGQDRTGGMSAGFGPAPMPNVDHGAREQQTYLRLLTSQNPSDRDLALKYFEAWHKKQAAAQDRLDKHTFNPPSEFMGPGGAILVTPGGQHDTARIEREKAAATRGGGTYTPAVQQGAPGQRNTVTDKFEPGPAGDKIRAFDQSARDVYGAADRFMEEFKTQGGAGINTFLNNPQDPKAQRLLAAYNNMIMSLRGEAFANTGVLQPAEITMLRDQMLAPDSLRGAMASVEAMQAKIDEMKRFIDMKRTNAYGSAGVQAPPLVDKAPPQGGGSVERWERVDGKLRRAP